VSRVVGVECIRTLTNEYRGAVGLTMRLSGRPAKTVRICSVLWMLAAPIIWLMSAMSSVITELSGRIEFGAFSTVALVGLLSGVGGLFRQRWAAQGLLAVSCVGVTYFFGVAAYSLVLPFVPWSTLKPPGMAALPMVSLLAVMAAPQGIPFLMMALALRRALRHSMNHVENGWPEGPGDETASNKPPRVD
jgi:hypothetical protein